MFEESRDDVEIEDIDGHNFTEVDRVSPKKGRLILFPANEYHCGSPPSKSDRMLVNFNFERLPGRASVTPKSPNWAQAIAPEMKASEW